MEIISTKQLDSSFIYQAKGLYKGKTVGLQFEVRKGFPAGVSSDGVNKKAFMGAGVKISSIGTESDEFIRALSELYKLPTTKPFTKKTIAVTAFSLNQSEVNLESSECYKFKFFLEEGSEALYSELYFNIDLGKKIIELKEKDDSYRESIIKVFTQ